MKIISVRSHGKGLFELRIDHPETQNRVSVALSLEFREALRMLRKESSLKVLILTGREDVFCAGATTQLLEGLLNGTLRVRDLFSPRELITFPAPVIGALEGPAVGGGLALVLGCDLLVASRGKRYGFNFCPMGFTPELGTTLVLPRKVGCAFAAEMLLTGKLYTGLELLSKGLFEYAEPIHEVRERAWDLAARMLDGPQETLRMVKETLAAPRLEGLEAALSKEDLMQRIRFADPETRTLISERYIHDAATPAEAKAPVFEKGIVSRKRELELVLHPDHV